MKKSNLVALLAVGALSATGLPAPAVAAPDPAYPGGSFSLSTTSAYIHDDGWRPPSASIQVVRRSLSDDVTPAKDIVIKLYSGYDGVPQSWSSTTDTSSLHYGPPYDDLSTPNNLAGTYQPYVTLTDGDGNLTRIDLPVVTLRDDRTPPKATLFLPKKSKRATILAWRHLRGSLIDYGLGPNGANYIVMQKRKGRFYIYDASTKKWKRGLATEAATYAKFKPVGNNAKMTSVSWYRDTWRSPYIHGLTRGRLVIRVGGTDMNLNGGTLREMRVAAVYNITRRR